MNNQTNQTKTMELVKSLVVELDGKTYKGMQLVKQIVKNNNKGNYRLYNMATGGIGTNSPTGNLLAKIGIQ